MFFLYTDKRKAASFTFFKYRQTQSIVFNAFHFSLILSHVTDLLFLSADLRLTLCNNSFYQEPFRLKWKLKSPPFNLFVSHLNPKYTLISQGSLFVLKLCLFVSHLCRFTFNCTATIVYPHFSLNRAGQIVDLSFCFTYMGLLLQ